MTSTVIFKTDSKLKTQAQKTAEELGLTLTSVMNNYLGNFVRNKHAYFSAQKMTHSDPYGSMPGKHISMKEIKKPSFDWQKAIQKLG